MATIYANFLERPCHGDYTLINATKDDRTLYHNIPLFLFTGQFLERVTTKGMHPNIEGNPEYIGFYQVDVYRYGYYYCLFVMNLPM
jgi:hypothetical protein